MVWTTLYEDYYCGGTFGIDRKELMANDLEQCREAVDSVSECSSTMYHCSPYWGFQCRCVMKDKSCTKKYGSSWNCKVETKGVIS